MQRRDAYPVDTALGACFVTGDYDPGEGIVDLDLWFDTLPVFGRACVSPKAVRMMVQVLGWRLHEGEMADQLDEAGAEIARLREDNLALRRSIANILQAAKLARLESWMEPA